MATSSKPPRPAPSNNVRALVRVPFHGGDLFAAGGEYADPGDRPVPLKQACERLGLTLAPQLVKLKGVVWATVSIIDMVAEDGKEREMACIPLSAFPMWLASLNPGKVAPELRPLLERYQCEATRVLYRHFLARPVVAPQPATDPALLATVQVLQRQMAELLAQRDHGVLGAARAEALVKKRLRTLARLGASIEGDSVRSRRGKLEDRLRTAISYHGAFELMPEALLHLVERHLAGVEQALLRRRPRRPAPRPGQLPLALVN